MSYMFKYYLISLIALVCVKTVRAHTDVDSIKMSVNLEEVVVEVPGAINSGGKSIYTPSRRLRESTNSAGQLLAGLQIPQLIVDLSSGNIALSGGGKLSIRINGRRASVGDVAALSSSDIARVDFIADPGVRYGDVDGVVDIVTLRRIRNGYSVFANLLQSPNRGWGNYVAALRYNVGKGEWSVDYQSNPMWQMECYRDNREVISTDDGVIVRNERGVKTPNRMVSHRASAQYSYAEGRDLLFNAQARLFRTNNFYRSVGDISTEIGDHVIESREIELNPLKSWQGDFDLYLFKRLSREDNIYVNLVPTLISSHSSHRYQTDCLEIENSARSRGFRYVAEIMWERHAGKGWLTSGLRSRGVFTSTDNLPMSTLTFDRSLTNDAFVEWRRQSDRWNLNLGLDAGYYSIWRPVSRGSFSIDPKVFVKFNCCDHASIAFVGERLTIEPTANELNPVNERVDQFQSAEGSLACRPFHSYLAKIEVDGNFRGVTGRLSVADTRAVNPLMTRKIERDGMIVRQPLNSGYNNHFEVKGHVTVSLFSRLLSLTVEGGWHTYASRGFDYRHRYSQPFVNAQLMIMKNHWWVMLKYNNSYNRLWGEMISSDSQNLTNIGVGYTHKTATFMAGIVNPFGNVAVFSRDLSKLASFDRTYQASGSHQLVWIGVTLNLRSGKNRPAVKKRLDNDQRYETINNAKK